MTEGEGDEDKVRRRGTGRERRNGEKEGKEMKSGKEGRESELLLAYYT